MKHCSEQKALWTEERVNISELEKQMNRRFNTPKNGIAPVKIKVIPTEDDLARIVQYCFKSPFKCKTFYKNEAKGIQMQHESTKSNRNIRLQRLMELNSLIEIRKLLISGGDGVRIKFDAAALLKAILDFQSVGSVEPLTIKDVENFWRKMRKRSKHQRYKKPKVSF
ncbi:hypothetical protein KUV57_24805 [Epibacterium sp. DP7N7-1]|nr:hypothetical protein [Epibacterium sp. DP7N7-1]